MISRRSFLATLGAFTGAAAFGSLLFPLERTQADTSFDVYLTFDDGPTSAKDFKTGPTDIVLDTLKAKAVNATFFLHGRAINDWEGPTLVRYLTDGHAIGNHLWRQGGNTVDDKTPWSLMTRQYLEAEVRIRDVLEKTDKSAFELYLAAPKLFRRPGGNNGLNDFLKPANFSLISNEPYVRPVLKTLDWIKQVYDYSGWHINGGESIPVKIRPETADAELKFILNGGGGYYGVTQFLTPRSVEADEGLIILLHDADKTTVEMLPKLIDQLRDMGAEFRSLPRPMDKPNEKTVGIGYAPTPKSG